MPYPYPSETTAAPPESTFLPHLNPAGTQDLRYTPTPTFLVTPLPVLPEVSRWYTYTFYVVSFQYPADWQIHSINSTDYSYFNFHAYFRLDRATDVSPFYWINLDFYIQERDAIPNPHSSEPNEGGYAVQWERPISVGGLPGIEFVWGAYKGKGEWDSLPTLNAWLYYAPKKLDIRLTAAFDRQTIDRALVEGHQPVIDESYVAFHHMLQSIQVIP